MNGDGIREVHIGQKEVKRIKPLYNIQSLHLSDGYLRTSDSTNALGTWDDVARESTSRLMQIVHDTKKKREDDTIDVLQENPVFDYDLFVGSDQIKLDIKVYNNMKKEQRELVDKGITRFKKVRETRPHDVRVYNCEARKQYDRRYKDESLVSDIFIQKEGLIKRVQVETIVKDKKALLPSYDNRFRANGIVEGVWNFKTKPTQSGEMDFSDLVDSYYGLVNGQGPIENSKIMYVQKGVAEHELRRPIGLRMWEDSDIIDRETQEGIDLFVTESGMWHLFKEGSPAYYAMLATPLGSGKWYLAEHHHDNMKVSAVELQRGSETRKYRARYYFAEKSEEESL